MTILDQIVADKKVALEHRKRDVPLSSLQGQPRPGPRGFKRALQGRGFHLIAEIKQASPSKGIISRDFRPVDLARAYERGGAVAISVLTEEKYFLGSLDHLRQVREAVGLPLLRKDFIFDAYQIYESAASGADAILLIASILDRSQLKELVGLSHSLELDCLVEVHSEAEVASALSSEAQIIGINNRDLRTFQVDLDTTRRLRRLIPGNRTVVSESGIRERGDIEKLASWDVHAALVGEALITATDIPTRIREMVTA